MIELILLGGGGHCESVIEVINGLDKFSIVGVLDPSFDEKAPRKIMGFPIIGNDDSIEKHIAKGRQFVITVGQIKSSKIREDLYNLIISKGGTLPAIVSRTAYVSSLALLGEGTVVLNNSFINAKAKLGRCAIVNTGSIIEHGCSIGDFCHISTGAILNGNVSSGNKVFIGSGSVINQNITIGHGTVVGSGSLVTKNVQSGLVVVGNPSKEKK